MNTELLKATLNLFKAVPIENKRKKKGNKEIIEEVIKNGIFFTPEIYSNYQDGEILDILDLVKEQFRLSGNQLNSSFHKSWQKVKTASMEQLIIEQTLHYFTTYGFEELGIYNESSIYIPPEKLKLPGIKEGLTLIIIKGYTKKELKEKVFSLLKSGIALKEETIEDIITILDFVGYDENEIDNIKNKETKIRLQLKAKIVPKNPVEFLRMLIFICTETTLLIKNQETIDLLKINCADNIYKLFKQYEKQYNLKRLAEIFYRFKSLWLAFRYNKDIRPIINKIRKLAIKYHKPMPKDHLNQITAIIENENTKLDEIIFNEKLEEANIWRKIRLLYALKYRTLDVDSILYRIRNGKGFSKKIEFKNQNGYKQIYSTVVKHIIESIKKNVERKTIYIPAYINYTLPSSEKQFIGYLPNGTSVKVGKDMIVGVHWENTKHKRIDLDLSANSLEIGKIGWDSAYRDEDASILFSGDMTNAPLPNGASELIYVCKQGKSDFLFNLNYYNFDSRVPVPFQIIVAQEQVKNMKRNYIVDPNNVICNIPMALDKKQKILGLLMTTTKENKFYFTDVNMGNKISSRADDHVTWSQKYLYTFNTNMVSLKEILQKAGAIITNKIEEDIKIDIDLSPEKLEKDTILNLLKEN